MKRSLVLVGFLTLLAACDDEKRSAVHEHEPTVKEDVAWTDQIPPIPPDARRIAVTVGDSGYEPNTMEVAPNEDVVLEMTRTGESECGRYIVVTGTDTRAELPLNVKVDIPVRAPASGQLVFACGMDMMHGVLKVVGVDAPKDSAPADDKDPAGKAG